MSLETSQEIGNKTTCYMKMENWFFARSIPQLQIKGSPCFTTNIPLLVWRVIALLYLSTFYILSLAMTPINSVINIFIYLTNYGYFFTWLYFANAVQGYIFQNKDPKQNQQLFSKDHQYAIQLLYEIAFCIEVTVTILYWALLFGYGSSAVSGYGFFANLSVHAMPMFLLLVEFPVNSYRFNALQVIVIISVAAVYGFGINLPYTLLVQPVYGILNWQSGLSVGLVIGAIAISTLAFGLGKLVYVCLKRKKLEKSQGISNDVKTIVVDQQSVH